MPRIPIHMTFPLTAIVTPMHRRTQCIAKHGAVGTIGDHTDQLINLRDELERSLSNNLDM